MIALVHAAANATLKMHWVSYGDKEGVSGVFSGMSVCVACYFSETHIKTSNKTVTRHSHPMQWRRGSAVGVGLWLAEFPWSVPDLLFTCDHFVGTASALFQRSNPRYRPTYNSFCVFFSWKSVR